MKQKSNKTARRDRIRLTAIIILSLLVIATGTLLMVTSFRKGEIAGGVLGMIIAVTILVFALLVFIRGNRDLKEGYPLKDERSKRVIEKASSTAFYVSLYLLLAIGYFSDDLIPFRDVSQATGVGVGGMALLFLIFWLYYHKKLSNYA
ncbi:hypothetical protein A3K73_04130 [Candidatus Pacearchaeota archaeon RBG_13_36_9]|nr:MAG: hypothetical protein A3K73_04130 [Candidatus Pacearchaeota archaeon RBG_13_36_9]